MISLGKFTEAELEVVSNLMYVIAPSERFNEGLSVQVVDGFRTWFAVTTFGKAMVKGERANFSGCYTLAPRLVREAELLCSLDDECEIFVDDFSARAVSESGINEMVIAKCAGSLKEFDIDFQTSAHLTHRALRHIFNFGSNEPMAYFAEGELDAVPAVSTVVFADGLLGVRTEFTEVGCNDLYTGQKAEVVGPVGEVSVSRVILRRLVPVLDKVGNWPVTVSADIENGGFLQIEGLGWKILFPRVNFGAGRYYDELHDRLLHAKIEFIEGDDARICARINDQNIVLDLLDGRWPVVRCTVELITGVERTLDLLREIDQQNEGRVGTKFFMRDDVVSACIDVRCDELEHLNEQLQSLVSDSDLLGSYLASLGIVGNELTLNY